MSDTNQISIVLVDDHDIVRDGIQSLLLTQEDFQVVGTAGSYKELLSLLKDSSPDIILLDINLPDKSGIEITRELAEKNAQVKIIILSMYITQDFIVNAFKCGAKGYIPKNTSKDDLFEAIRTVSGGGEYYHPIIAKALVGSITKEAERQQEQDLLSRREIEVLTLYAKGMTNKEISDKLFISPRTVESHKNHIMQKLDVKSQIDMLKYAIRNKLTDL